MKRRSKYLLIKKGLENYNLVVLLEKAHEGTQHACRDAVSTRLLSQTVNSYLH